MTGFYKSSVEGFYKGLSPFLYGVIVPIRVSVRVMKLPNVGSGLIRC